MIRKLVRQMLTAQILSALTVSLCLLIDSVMISRFLGVEAIAAYGLANPLLLGIGAVGTLLAAGVQVVCGKALGRGSQEEANEGYSSALAVAAVVSLLFLIGVILFRTPLAKILGARGNSMLCRHTSDYLAGFSIGAPGSIGALVLVPFLQMAGQSNLLIVSVLTMTVVDVGLDLVTVLAFPGGMFGMGPMFGMGLASSLSYFAALAVASRYFLSKKSVFRFSLKNVRPRMIGNLFVNGIPAGFMMLSTVLLVFVMNKLLTVLDGSTAVAAFTVAVSIGNAANCVTTGIGGVSLTIGGVLFHEEDRTGLKELVRQLCRWGIILGLAVGVLIAVFAPAMVSVFIPETGKTWELTVLCLRLFAIGMVPCCINSALKNVYQATGRMSITEAVFIMEGAIFPAFAAFCLSRFMGTTGVWLYFAVGETLTLLGIGLLIRLKTGNLPWKDGAYLLLKKLFGADPDRMLEMDISSMEEAAAAAEKAEAFCLQRGQDARISNHIALCIEKMASNVIQHGFQKDSGTHYLSVMLLEKSKYWVIRFRDNCRAFDPVHYVPQEKDQGVGIRLVLSLASEALYTYSMNLNNLTLKLPKQQEKASP